MLLYSTVEKYTHLRLLVEFGIDGRIPGCLSVLKEAQIEAYHDAAKRIHGSDYEGRALPEASSRFSRARPSRISFAYRSARMR